MTLRDSLAQVQELLGRATPGEFRTFGESLHTGISRDNEWMAEMWNEDDAQAIAAAVNWIREHGPELMKRLDRYGAGDAEDAARYRWLRAGDNDELVIQRQYRRVAPFLLRGEKLDAAIDAARAGERGVA